MTDSHLIFMKICLVTMQDDHLEIIFHKFEINMAFYICGKKLKKDIHLEEYRV